MLSIFDDPTLGVGSPRFKVYDDRHTYLHELPCGMLETLRINLQTPGTFAVGSNYNVKQFISSVQGNGDYKLVFQGEWAAVGHIDANFERPSR